MQILEQGIDNFFQNKEFVEHVITISTGKSSTNLGEPSAKILEDLVYAMCDAVASYMVTVMTIGNPKQHRKDRDRALKLLNINEAEHGELAKADPIIQETTIVSHAVQNNYKYLIELNIRNFLSGSGGPVAIS